jgi:SAM-dependent methyltransferase
MNRDYWDRQAGEWDQAIFNSLREDVDGVVRRAIRAAARRHSTVLDFGCGVGGYLPFLSATFENVHAVDWSPQCVELAVHRAGRLPNVTVERSTPSALARLERSVGCVVAANVVIHPAARVRRTLWRSIRRVLKRGGTGIFVVPSLESAAYCEFIRRRVAPRRASSYDFHPRGVRAEAGTVGIEGVPTKHYTGEELDATLALAGFHLTRLAHVRYRWSTESLTPPRSLRARLPWDWLAVARAV